MGIWNDKVWNYQVHQRLGESLYYFLVDIRPFEPKKAAAGLRALIAQRELGSTRVFTTFGAYDLMVRAWLHPSITGRLPGWLDTALGAQHLQDLQTFAVTQIHKRWYDSQVTDEGRTILNALDEHMVVAAQKEDGVVERLVKHGLVVPRVPSNSPLIKFFVTVRFATDVAGVTQGVVRDIEEHIAHEHQLRFVSIYSGFGFASILITGHVETQDFFAIGGLPHWISDRFTHFRASTETFLVMAPTEIAGDEAIGGATFRELAGRDLLVQSIIRELYDGTYTQAKKQAVESFVWHNLKQIVLTERDRQLLHDCLLGYIDDDPAEMAKSLLIFFVGVESYLRQALGEYVGRRSDRPLGRLMQDAGISKSDSRFLVFGDLLRLYALVLPEDLRPSVQVLQPLTEIRNALAHEGTDVLEDWETHLARLAAALPAVRRFISGIEETTSRLYKGEY